MSAEERLIPEIQAVRALFLQKESSFQAKGYEIALEPHGQATIGGRRGLLLTMRSPKTGDTHTLSIEIGIDALEHVKLLVDGRLSQQITGGAQFIRQPTFLADMERVIDYVIDRNLSPPKA